MATNGIVSIVNEQGEMLVKVICGCDGYNAEHVVKWLKENPTLDIEEIYTHSLTLDFGCEKCLVVMNATEEKILFDDELLNLYREKFTDPNFNPRWEAGTADYVELVVHASVPTRRPPDAGDSAQ